MTNPIQAQTGSRLSDGVTLRGSYEGVKRRGYGSAAVGKWGDVLRRPDRVPGTT